jgi:hypothetical protein
MPDRNLALTLAIIAPVVAGLTFVRAADDLELLRTQESPRADIMIKTYADRKTGKNQIWLEAARDQTRRSLLYTYARSGTIVMSPNEEMIAFNHDYASTDSTVVLFRKIDDIHYQPLDCDPAPAVWNLFKSVYNKNADLLDHTYIECVGWSRDASTMLIKAYGHGNGHSLSGWYCAFDVKSCVASADLSLINRNALDR